MNQNENTNSVSDYHNWVSSRRGLSVAAKVLIIMIAAVLLLSLRASITRADDPPVKPVIYLPVVAQPSKPLPTDWEQAIREIVNRAAKLAPLAEDRDDKETESLEPPGDDYRYTYEKHDVVDNITEVLYLGLNDDVIWPGSLVRGDTVHDFVYNPILLPRAPIMLSLDLESSTTGDSISQEVVDPKLSSVRQGISDLLKKAVVEDTTVPAKTDFLYEQVYNESQMSLYAEANIEYGAGSLDTRFDWDSINKKNKIMVRYRQIYFSVDIDTPATPAALFDRSRTSVSEIGAAMPAGSMPMYVASVKYGMMALMFIETDFSKDEMALALDAAYGKGDLEADLGFGYSTKDVMQQSKVQIVVYGGSVEGLDEFEGYESFKNVMFASRNFTSDSPGVPLVYKFRHLKDNTLGLITLTSQYTLVKPLQIRQRVRITVHDLIQTGCSDGSGGCELDRMGVWVKGWNRRDTSDEGILVTPADHPTHGAQVFYRVTDGEWPAIPPIPVNESLDLTFSTDYPYDFNLARMYFTGYAREWDTPTNPPEDSHGYYEVFGNFFFGEHQIPVGGGDYAGYYRTTIIRIPSSPYPPPSPFTGTPVSFESYNVPNHYLYDENFMIRLTGNDGTPAFAKYATFKKRLGLAGRDKDTLASFESINFPGYYLRYLHVPFLDLYPVIVGRDDGTTQFAQDATFRMVSGLADADLLSFASVNHPGYYLRHSNYQLYLLPYDHTTQFAADATFKEMEGLAK